MTAAPLQLSFEDERRALKAAEQAGERYRRTLAALDMRHAVEALAVEDDDRMAGPRAAPCRCPRPWTDDRETCGRCGRAVATEATA